LTTPEVRLATWSGPRNISTAMMRSWEIRPDCMVVDEPLYAYYLYESGIDHPARELVIASMPRDLRQVVDRLYAPLPAGVTVFYQKHMTHHLLPGMDRDWIGRLDNAFLIRDPAHVVASYAKVRDEPTLADLGFTQQAEIFRSFGGPVVDSADLLRDPHGVLTKLCAALGIPFDEAMLSWPPGRRDTDGVWAPYWYASVEASTGFGPYREATADVPEHLERLAGRCRPFYDELATRRI
jgi:hypothetical protein